MFIFHQLGNPVSATATADTNAGTVFDISDFGYRAEAGVTTSSVTSGDVMTLQTAGVWKIENAGDAAFSAGDDVDWDPDAGEIVATGTGGGNSIAVGEIFKDNATTDEYVYVILNSRLLGA